MSKYDTYHYSLNDDNIQNILTSNETLLWEAKPKKSAFIINKVIRMFPIALLWILFDGFFLMTFLSTGAWESMAFFIIPFFAFHLMPVWIWLSHVITAYKRWKNTHYIMTDKRIIIQSGFIGMEYQSLYYKDIHNVHLNIGIIDKCLGVGDIYFHVVGSYEQKGQSAFLDIEDVYQIYPKIQQIVMDIQTDIEYPNAYRPDENPGYHTKYKQ